MDQFLQTMAQNDRESLLQEGMELYFSFLFKNMRAHPRRAKRREAFWRAERSEAELSQISNYIPGLCFLMFS